MRSTPCGSANAPPTATYTERRSYQVQGHLHRQMSSSVVYITMPLLQSRAVVLSPLVMMVLSDLSINVASTPALPVIKKFLSYTGVGMFEYVTRTVPCSTFGTLNCTHIITMCPIRVHRVPRTKAPLETVYEGTTIGYKDTEYRSIMIYADCKLSVCHSLVCSSVDNVDHPIVAFVAAPQQANRIVARDRIYSVYSLRLT